MSHGDNRSVRLLNQHRDVITLTEQRYVYISVSATVYLGMTKVRRSLCPCVELQVWECVYEWT